MERLHFACPKTGQDVDVGIDSDNAGDADMGELLDDMRTAAAQADDPDSDPGEARIAVRAEKALPVISAHRASPSSQSGAPTAVKRVIWCGPSVRDSQRSPRI